MNWASFGINEKPGEANLLVLNAAEEGKSSGFAFRQMPHWLAKFWLRFGGLMCLVLVDMCGSVNFKWQLLEEHLRGLGAGERSPIAF